MEGQLGKKNPERSKQKKNDGLKGGFDARC
jgi:hypothetical protein